MQNLSIFFCSLVISLLALSTNSFAQDLKGNKVNDYLQEIINNLQNHQLRDALAKSEELIYQLPQFQAGKVLRGDILTAMSGSATINNDSQLRITSYREELIKRIEQLADQEIIGKTITYPVHLSPKIKYWFYSDLANSRLYVIANQNNQHKIVDSFYLSLGFNGSDKVKEGDNRTPVGVYRITSFIPQNRLDDFYGAGAYPMSYPNNYDLALGKTGSGIWIHGVPANLFSRPPLATNGCVALANEDIKKIDKYITVGETFVVSSNKPLLPEENSDNKLINSLINSFNRWIQDWESLDNNKYLSYYSKDFKSDDGMNLANFRQHKTDVNANKSYIKVNAKDIAIFAYPKENVGEENIFWLSYYQDYQSSNFSQSTPKEQIWREKNGKWEIVFEGGLSKGR